MKYRNLRFILTASFLLLCSFTVAAQQEPEAGADGLRMLTLDECIALGLEQNLEVTRSKLNVERSKTSKMEAIGQFIPSLSTSASWAHYDRDNFVFRNDQLLRSRDSWSISAVSSLELFDGMANYGTFDQSLLNLEASELDFSRQKETFVYTITDAYYNALRLLQLLRVTEANLERSRDQLEKIKQQHAVGSVPQADIYRQEVEVGRFNLQYQQSKNDFDNAKADLLNLVGEYPGEEIRLDEGSLATAVSTGEIERYRADIGDYEDLYKNALERRDDYESSTLGLESAEKSKTIAFSGHLPSLTASARYNWNNYELRDVLNDGSSSFGLTLSFPILSNMRTAAAVERAEINYRESQEIHAQLERTIAVNLRKALNTLDYAAENVRIAQQTLRSAREDRRIAEERYNLGAGILLDLTTANANLLSAESDLVNARFNYLRAKTYLEYQIGILQ